MRMLLVMGWQRQEHMVVKRKKSLQQNMASLKSMHLRESQIIILVEATHNLIRTENLHAELHRNICRIALYAVSS